MNNFIFRGIIINHLQNEPVIQPPQKNVKNNDTGPSPSSFVELSSLFLLNITDRSTKVGPYTADESPYLIIENGFKKFNKNN